RAALQDRAKEAGIRFSDIRPRRNSKPRSDRLNLPIAQIVSMYEKGMTKTAIANHFGVSQSTIGKYLSKGGYPPAPNRSEAARIHLGRMTLEERLALTAPAHEAVRGRRVPESELIKRAKGRQRNLS